MRTLIATATFIAILFAGFACKSKDGLSKKEKIAQITEKIDNANYTFIPQTALPMGGKSVNLGVDFSLRVSKDTINSYLPYFGRAYRAPVGMDEGGIKFISTDFNYTSTEKKQGEWSITIEPKGNNKKYRLMLEVGDTGYGTLSVNDNDRQSISFYGRIE